MKVVKFVVFLILIVNSTNIFAASLSKGESRRKLIQKAQEAYKEGHIKKAVKLYKQHLRSWKDIEASKELAGIYLSQEKYFLAGKIYYEAKLFDEYKKVEQLRLKHKEDNGNPKVWEKARIAAERKKTSSRIRRGFGAAMMIAGPIFAGTGFSLLIAENVYGRENNKYLQYAFMIGGLTMTGGGVMLDYSADYNRNISEVYSLISEKYYDSGTTTKEYYLETGMDKIVKKSSVKSLNAHGAGLLLISLPLFAVGIYSFYESSKVFSGDTTTSEKVLNAYIYAMQSLVFAPPIILVVTGVIYFMKASRFEVLGVDSDTKISLNYISPKIDPITKTYGISMGFSF